MQSGMKNCLQGLQFARATQRKSPCREKALRRWREKRQIHIVHLRKLGHLLVHENPKKKKNYHISVVSSREIYDEIPKKGTHPKTRIIMQHHLISFRVYRSTFSFSVTGPSCFAEKRESDFMASLNVYYPSYCRDDRELQD